ncbi:hypothetical protein HanRHA438_Chr01g0044901 [Helianthus annuus]|nr:hypothetical protein HanRHA438_Chr01g0044901 [Helianthus annuus]
MIYVEMRFIAKETDRKSVETGSGVCRNCRRKNRPDYVEDEGTCLVLKVLKFYIIGPCT